MAKEKQVRCPHCGCVAYGGSAKCPSCGEYLSWESRIVYLPALEPKKLIIFDFDGVLVTVSWKGLFEANKQVLFHAGKDWRDFFPDLESFKLYSTDWQENRKKWGIENSEFLNKIFNNVYAPYSVCISGVEEILKKLSKKCQLAILTNGHRSRILMLGKNVLGLFKIIVAAKDVKKLKPDPEGINLILVETGFQKDQAVIVGDHPTDIKAGRAAGIKTAAVVWEHGLSERKDFLDCSPDFFLESLDDLPSLDF
ncbi:HAD family hydrolase [Patescibacteria group bacterium]|nr:HAD family hydrolase [Patescibacteria group bacterium]